MPMLTWEEAGRAYNDAMDASKEDLDRLMADAVPQGTLDKITEQAIEYFSAKTGNDEEGTAYLTTTWISGFHVGWLMARRVYNEW
jgi:hypothetical protein